MGSLAAAPELYPELVRLGAVPSLLALLAHDNADVAAEGALLLRELTDADAAAESDAALAGAAALAEALSAGADAEEPEACAGLAALVAALGRFDETQAEEASAVHSLLNVFENLVEISPVLRDRLLAPAAGLLAWLLRRVTAPGGCIDANRVYAAELLAVLLAGGDAAARRLGEAGGVDALLRAIAPFKGGKKAKERPKDEAETEMARHRLRLHL
jgi:beta-catenin-like protein 1